MAPRCALLLVFYSIFKESVNRFDDYEGHWFLGPYSRSL